VIILAYTTHWVGKFYLRFKAAKPPKTAAALLTNDFSPFFKNEKSQWLAKKICLHIYVKPLVLFILQYDLILARLCSLFVKLTKATLKYVAACLKPVIIIQLFAV
jgi:hypothetical protein